MLGATIAAVHGRQILDSRGRPTVEVDVRLHDGTLGRAAVPAGASTGRHEAWELRDRNPEYYGGYGVLRAVGHVNDVIGPAVVGQDATEQARLDARLHELDASPNWAQLGANAVLGVSLAACRAAARVQGRRLYQWLGALAGVDEPTLPLPMVNILSGGLHAGRGMDVQDFLAMPVGATSLADALQTIAAVRRAAGALLAERGLSVLLADEGGFAPGFATAAEALDLLVAAIERAGYRPGADVAIAVDVAASQLADEHGGYRLAREGCTLTAAAMVDRVRGWLDRYPVVSVEDPLGEDDWAAWHVLTAALGARVQLVGDDLFCTNPARIQQGIDLGVANAVLVKLNQIGTLSDTLAALALARAHGYRPVISARSGETEDPFIADLAVGTAAGQIKIGSLATSERLAKYNQLLRLEELVGYVRGGVLGDTPSPPPGAAPLDPA